MYCDICGERMCGDGYHVVFYCPNAPTESWEWSEPDGKAIHCPLVHVSVWKTAKAAVPESG
jgi:hypothetical protein